MHLNATHSSRTTDKRQRVRTALQSLLGNDCVVEGDALDAQARSDWSGAESVAPVALLLARTPQAVAAVLRICNAERQPVAVQGGLTGLAGGANPQHGEIALSLARLNAIEDFDS